MNEILEILLQSRDQQEERNASQLVDLTTKISLKTKILKRYNKSTTNCKTLTTTRMRELKRYDGFHSVLENIGSTKKNDHGTLYVKEWSPCFTKRLKFFGKDSNMSYLGRGNASSRAVFPILATNYIWICYKRVRKKLKRFNDSKKGRVKNNDCNAETFMGFITPSSCKTVTTLRSTSLVVYLGYAFFVSASGRRKHCLIWNEHWLVGFHRYIVLRNRRNYREADGMKKGRCTDLHPRWLYRPGSSYRLIQIQSAENERWAYFTTLLK